jgi:hypothetical protein
MSKKEKSRADLEWERRVLCSDEACIGTIGANGRCKECGKAFEGELPAGLDEVVIETEDDDLMDVDGDDAAQSPEGDQGELEGPDEDGADDDEWANRRLCSDEACIGVIGPDGMCKECGRPYEE